MRKQIAAFLFMFVLTALFVGMPAKYCNAQEEERTFRYYDSKTYHYYEAGWYDSVIYAGNEALKEGYDYFFLRLRLGLAWFHLENYRTASQHLGKAVAFSGNDPVALEYLYLSYLYTNRDRAADYVFGRFGASLQEKYKNERTELVSALAMDAGYLAGNSFRKSGNKSHSLYMPDSIYGEADMNGNRFFFGTGINLRFSPRFSGYLGYTGVHSQKRKLIVTNEYHKAGYDTIPYNGGYYTDTVYDKKPVQYKDDYHLKQHQLHASAAAYCGNTWSVLPSVTLIQLSYNTIFPSLSYVNAQSYDTIPSIPVYSLTQVSKSPFEKVFSLGVTKSFNRFDAGLRASYSDLNKGEQYQLEGSAAWFPSGNLNTYFQSAVYLQMENKEGNLFVSQTVGFRTASFLWIEGMLAGGRIKNHNEANGAVVFNTGDEVRFRAGLHAVFLLSKRVTFTARCSYDSMSGYSLRYTDYSTFVIHSEDYHHFSLSGGLLCKF